MIGGVKAHHDGRGSRPVGLLKVVVTTRERFIRCPLQLVVQRGEEAVVGKQVPGR